MFDLKIKTAAIAMAAAGFAGTAGAEVIDFTDMHTGASGTLSGGIGWTITAVNGELNNRQGYDGGANPASDPGLAFDRDGYGIDDDEISNGRSQSIVLDFTRNVTLTAASFLDVFNPEFATISVDGMQVAQADATGEAGGFSFLDGLNVTSRSFAFFASVPDETGPAGDVALASVDVSAVPVPAAGLLLIGALGGMGALRRRKGA